MIILAAPQDGVESARVADLTAIPSTAAVGLLVIPSPSVGARLPVCSDVVSGPWADARAGGSAGRIDMICRDATGVGGDNRRMRWQTVW